MTKFCHQLKLLLWKNFKLRLRHKVRCLIEIIWPLVLFLILMWVRTRGLKEGRSSCHLIPKALPSVGGFEFFQNYLCSLNNTCHTRYVEEDQNIWRNASIIRMVNQATPLLEEISSNNNTLSTFRLMWSNLKLFIKYISGLRSRADLLQLGSITAEKLLTPEGKESFLESAPTYIGLDRKELENALQTEIDLQALSSTNLQELLQDFRTGECGPNKTYSVIKKNPPDKTYKKLCSLGPQKAFLLLYIFTSFMDQKGVAGEIASDLALSNLELLNSMSSISGSTYDSTVLQNVMKLGRLIADDPITNFSSLFNSSQPISGADTARFYALICGTAGNNNRSMFGFENEGANRYDSLRDNLKDWRKEETYEPDPDISPICNTIFMRFESSSLTSFFWKQIKPFVRGSIYYAPNTTFTREIMRKVDEKFSKIKDVENDVNILISILHRVRFWVRNNSEDIETLKEILSDPVTLKKALEFANVQLDPIQTKQLEGFIKWVRENDIEKFLERIDLIAEVLSELLNCMRYDKTKPFKTEEEAVKAALPLLPMDNLWAVVIFDDLSNDSNTTSNNNNSPPRLTTYKIRMDSDKVDSTKSFRDRITRRFPRRRPIFDLKYVTSGFVYLQEFIEQSLIEMHTNKSLDGFNIYLQQFPFPCYIYDQFIRAVSRTFPLFMVLSWLYASAMIIKSIVLEKEKHIRETMKVMGLSNLCIWAGWFIDSFSIMAFSATILSVLLKWGRVIENSEFTLIWVFMISFTVSAICFSFLISTFFSRANSAAAAGGVLFFVTYLPYNWILIWEDHLEWFHILCGCLLSNVAFGFGCLTIAKAEEDGWGARWDRVSLSQSPEEDFNLSYCILMMWVDSVLYLILTLYFEAIMPGTGTPKKWYFLFQKSTWVSSKPKDPKKLQEEIQSALHHHADDDVRVEEEPEGLTCGISIHNLCKTYSNGKVALTNLNLNFYENQITSFLGHNGAGKTSCISILTGLFSPTSGTAYVYGKDIRKEMSTIRKDLGICPQFNVLFDRLTVEEHMKFFAGLKGKDKIQKDEIDKMLVDLGIPEKRHEFPGNLSGGMKRKLCVAIAFVGGSKTVYLDEPTSGVDPYSRRSIWELLLKYKRGRTICLTTHYMDEAELLGDRIAIISQGKLKTCGSSLFLKTHFGQGYSLHLVKKEHLSHDNETLQHIPTTTTTAENEALINIEPVNPIPKEKVVESIKKLKSIIPSFIKFRVSEAILVDDIKTEMTFLLPYDSTSSFSKLLGDLDDNMNSLGISSYGISDTSLEDIFLKITLEDLEETDSIKSGSRKRKLRGYCACCFNIGKKDENRIDDYSRIQGQKEKSIHQDKNESIHENHSPGEDTDETHVINSTPESEVLLEHHHPDTDDEMTVTFKPSTMTNDHISNTKSNNRHNNHSNGPELHSLLNEEQQQEQQQNSDHQIPVEEEESIPVKKKIKRNFCSLCWIQICAIILKRFRNSRSNLKAMFFEIILPAVFIAFTLTFTLLFPKPGDEPPREITPFVYPSPTNIFFSEVNQTKKNEKEKEAVEDFNRIINELTGPIGMGTPCLKQKLKEKVCDLNPNLWSNASLAKFETKRRAFGQKDAKLGTCSCKHGSQVCDKDSKIENEPPKLATRTHDFIQDTTQYFLPEYLEKTYKKYDLHRYGGYEFQLRDPSNVNFTHFINLIDILTTLDKEPHTPEPNITVDKIKAIKIWYENRGWFSSVAYLNALHNMILRENLPDTFIKDKSEFGITLIQHPLNLTESQQSKENLKTSFIGVVHAVCIILALSFVPASFTVYLIEEKSNGGKHLHLVSGVKPITYWVANFIYDMYKYMIPAILAVILFILFDAHAYVSEHSIWAFSLLLALYGWSSIPLMYPATYIFRIPSTAFVTLACLNLFIGVITTLSTFVLEQFGDEELEHIGNVLKKLFLIFPHYCLGRGLIELVALDIISTAQTSFKISHYEINRFDWELGLGKMHVSLLIQGFVFFFINLACDYKQHVLRFTKRKPKYVKDDLNEEDEDVHRERERVLNDENISKTSVLAAENLTKFYKRKKLPSVNRLSFAIEEGECFGLLGVNGAGKTTTFKMLTGDVKISSGKAYICGFDVEKDRDFARKHFGYCPQEDSLDSLLNSYEMLELYGRLRGMGRKETREASEKLIKTLGLTRYAKRNCGTYSGGNKRKLNTAIALIGDPDIVFLDEPTSGMDPGARRQLWAVILELIRTGKSVVLTSHSMEECEALCTRLGLMVNAQFVCFGSIQHLKNRFGKGYVLTIRLSGEEKRDEFLKIMEQNLPSAVHTDSHFTQMKFSIPQESVKLREVFEIVYLAKNDNIIEDYSLSQTTLDDIFVQFAKHQRDELDR